MMAPRLPRWLWRWFRNDHHWETLSFFRGVPIFQGLTRRQLGRVMMAMQRRPYRAGEVLFEEGQVGRAVFILKSGKVELSRKSGSTRRVLGVLTPGQMFGEMALLEHMQRTASATVLEDGEIYLLYTASLDALIHQHPNIGVVLLRNMAVMLSALLRRTNIELDNRARPAA
jgi:CRP/FNR family transcriptional regulator, cyclic AMP receptor protein